MKERALPLLIDTNILRQLHSRDGISANLKRLEYHVLHGQIFLLYPAVLQEEWQKHRELLRAARMKDIKEQQKEINRRKALNDPSASQSQRELDQLAAMSDEQFDRIDALVKNGRHIPRNDGMLKRIFDLRAKKKAPFHNPDHKDHINDAELIYYSIDYAKRNEYTELYFLADNPSEFGAQNNPEAPLHPDILNFEKVTVLYHTNVRTLFPAFDKLGFTYIPEDESREYKKINNSIIIDRDAPLIDQIIEYLEKRFAEFTFLPKQLFTEHYPFIKDDFFIYADKPFTLVTDNKELYDLLSSSDEQRDEAESKKLLWIKQKLFDNNIGRVGFKLEHEILIPLEHQTIIHNEELSQYQHHELFGLLKKLSAPEAALLTGNIKTDLQRAYTFYKIGNYKAAAMLLLNIKKNNQEQKSIHYYITCFNLVKISKPLRFSYGKPEIEALARECQSIDLDKQRLKITEPHLAEIVEYIHNTQFFKDNFYGLQGVLNEIKSHQLRQNTGFNHNTEQLMEQYFAAESFLNRNSIIFDCYNEFLGLASQYTEGLFASYACDEFMVGKLNFFTDPLLLPMIFYQKPEYIFEHGDRYKIVMASYQPEKKGKLVSDLLMNILSEYESIKSNFAAAIENDCYYFFYFYFQRLNNCLVLFSFADIEKDIINTITKKLFLFLIAQDYYPFAYISKWVLLFLRKNVNKLAPSLLQELLITAIENKTLHSDELFVCLHELFKKKNLPAEMPEDNFLNFSNNFLGPCGLCAKEHPWDYLYDIFSILGNGGQKEKIRQKAEENLEHQFDAEKYYLAVLGDMLKPSESSNDLYLEQIAKMLESMPKNRASLRKSFYADGRIDHYINFCFGLGIDIPDRVKSALADKGVYYNWLINMEGFDYANFKPEWAHHHFTSHYKKKYQQSASLKNYFEKQFADGQLNEYLRFYFVTYCQKGLKNRDAEI